MDIYRTLLTAALAGVVASCSPYGFSNEVGELGTQATKFSGSVTSGHQALVDDGTAKYRRDLISAKAPVSLAFSCDTTPTAVAPVVYDTSPKKPDDKQKDGDKTSKPDEDKTAKAPGRVPCDVYLDADKDKVRQDPYKLADTPKLQESITALTSYMTALAAVTNATDRTNYTAAVTKLGTAVSSMVALVPGAGTVLSGEIGAGINIFGWLVGTALDIQRFQALKQAVNKVDTIPPGGTTKPFDTVVMAIAGGIDDIAERRRRLLVKDARRLADSLANSPDEATYRARLADVQALTSALEALNQRAMTAGNALIVAHGKLVVAVNAYQPDLNDLLTAIEAVKDQVTTLEGALSGASAPAPAAKTSAKKGS